MNLFTLPEYLPEQELTEPLCGGETRIERIVSCGQHSPEGFWYDQAEDEWVALLAGSATLLFADTGLAELRAGDCLLIGAHRRHRVERTSTRPPCVWLCVFGRLTPPEDGGKLER
ncbi:MAG: cupin domain-containing protein [Clostridia bacterium]|nr:cupin domain-containing protein [Clostridia bacterium]